MADGERPKTPEKLDPLEAVDPCAGDNTAEMVLTPKKPTLDRLQDLEWRAERLEAVYEKLSKQSENLEKKFASHEDDVEQVSIVEKVLEIFEDNVCYVKLWLVCARILIESICENELSSSATFRRLWKQSRKTLEGRNELKEILEKFELDKQSGRYLYAIESLFGAHMKKINSISTPKERDIHYKRLDQIIQDENLVKVLRAGLSLYVETEEELPPDSARDSVDEELAVVVSEYIKDLDLSTDSGQMEITELGAENCSTEDEQLVETTRNNTGKQKEDFHSIAATSASETNSVSSVKSVPKSPSKDLVTEAAEIFLQNQAPGFGGFPRDMFDEIVEKRLDNVTELFCEVYTKSLAESRRSGEEVAETNGE